MGVDVTGSGSLADLGGKIIDKIWPSPEDKAKRDQAKAALLTAQQNGSLDELQAFPGADEAQMEVNKAEAVSDHIFVAGWRPFIGWVCGMAFTYNFVVGPLSVAIARIWLPQFSAPELDFSQMTPVLLGMLGLGGMRSFEKYKGITKQAVGH